MSERREEIESLKEQMDMAISVEKVNKVRFVKKQRKEAYLEEKKDSLGSKIAKKLFEHYRELSPDLAHTISRNAIQSD